MGSRTEQITIYVTEERKTELEQRADAQDDSVSGVVNDMINRQLQQDAQDAIASETRAEERIQELIQVGTEEMTELAREIRDMNAKFGAYSIANFELMKRDRSDHVRKEALTTGARRIRQDLDVVTEDLAAAAAPVADEGTGQADGNAASTADNADAKDLAQEPADQPSMSAAEAMTGGDTAGSPADQEDSTADASETEGAEDAAADDDSDDSPSDGGLFDRLRSDRE